MKNKQKEKIKKEEIKEGREDRRRLKVEGEKREGGMYGQNFLENIICCVFFLDVIF